MAYNLPGSIIDAATAAAAQVNAALEAATPKFEDMLNSIKSGEIFKSIDSQLSSLTSALSAAGDTASTAVADIKSAVSAAQGNLAVDMAVAKASVEMAAKIAASKGESLSEQKIEELINAPLAVLKNAQSMAANAASLANSGVSAISNLQSQLEGAVGAGVSDLLQQLSNAQAAVSNGIADAAANFEKMAKDAADSKADTINTLKASLLLSSLTKPTIPAMASITSGSMNLSKIDPYNAIKAQENPVPAVIPASQRPAVDPIRPGTSGFIRDFAGYLPAESLPTKQIWTYELNQLNAEVKTAQEEYYSSFSSSAAASKEERQEAFDVWYKTLNLRVNGPAAESIREQSVAIKKAKPNVEDRTAEEIEITVQSANYGKVVRADPEFINVRVTLLDNVKLLEKWYQELYDAWITSKSRFDLNSELLEKISRYNR